MLNILQCTGQPLKTMNYPASNVNGITAENSYVRESMTCFFACIGTGPSEESLETNERKRMVSVLSPVSQVSFQFLHRKDLGPEAEILYLS